MSTSKQAASVNIFVNNSVSVDNSSIPVMFPSDVVNSVRSIHVNTTTWHGKLGHASFKVLQHLSNNISLNALDSKCVASCEIYPLLKQKQLSFNSSNHLASNCFDLVHCDIWGPFNTATYNGKRYFLTLGDDHSRFTWVYLLTHKSDASTCITNFFTMVETQHDRRIKQFRSDNAKEH